MTAVSAIVFFLGLLFGFQRPSRLLLPRLCATVLLAAPQSTRGLHSLFRTGFSVKRPLPPRSTVSPRFGFNIAPPRFVSSFRGGAEPTSFPPSLSTAFVDPFLSARSASSPSRFLRLGGGGFYHRRVRCQLRSLTSYFLFHFFSSGASVATATSPFRPRGRGFYHRRVESQLRTADSVFRFSRSPGAPPQPRSTEPSYPPPHPFRSGACGAVAPARRAKGRDT